MSEKTELQRQILIEAYDNRHLNQREIAERVGCSRSYVSTVLNRYDGHDAMEARIEELNSQLGIEPSRASSVGGGQHRGDDVPQIDWDQIGRSLQNGICGLRVLLAKATGDGEAADDLPTGRAIAYLLQGTVAATILGLVLYFLARAVLITV